MTVERVGSVLAEHFAAGNVTVDWSSVDWEDGDFLAVFCFNESNGGFLWSRPDDFRTIISDNERTKFALYFRFLETGDDETADFDNGHGQSDEGFTIAAVYRGVDRGLPFGLTVGRLVGGDTINTTPDPTTLLLDDSLVALFFGGNDNEITAIGAPTGYTLRESGTTTQRKAALAEKAVDAGVETPGAWQHSGTPSTTDSISVTLPLQPAGALDGKGVGWLEVDTSSNTELTPDLSEIDWEPDDVAVALAVVDGDGGGATGVPTDWNKYAEFATGSGSDLRLAAYWKVLEEGEDETPLFDLSTGSAELGMLVMVFRGVDPSDPFDAYTQNWTENDADAPPPALTPTTGKLLVTTAYPNGNDTILSPGSHGSDVADYHLGAFLSGAAHTKRCCIMAVGLLDSVEEVTPTGWTTDSPATADWGQFSAAFNLLPAPDAPTNPAATAQSASSIRVTWTDVDDETGYRVERSPNGSDGWSDVSGALAADTTQWDDTGLTASTQYFYRVIAVSGAGDSDPSSTVNATTSAPSGDSANRIGGTGAVRRSPNV